MGSTRKINLDEFKCQIGNTWLLLSEYQSQDKPITLQCTKCNFVRELKQAKNASKHTECINCIKIQCANGTAINQVYSYFKYGLKEVIEYCVNHQMVFLDNQYFGIHYKHKFQCRNNHIWLDTFGELLRKNKRGNYGCRQCICESLKYDKEYLIAEFANKGFAIVGARNGKKILTKCKKCEHVWQANIFPILHHNVGCPKCNLYLNEKLTGEFLRLLFPSIKIGKLYLKQEIVIDGKRIKRGLYIDYAFQIDNKQIYVEYHGIQHYKETKFKGHTTDLKKQQLRDEWLRQYCMQNNIILIEINGMIYTKENILDYLKIEFAKLKLYNPGEAIKIQVAV